MMLGQTGASELVTHSFSLCESELNVSFHTMWQESALFSLSSFEENDMKLCYDNIIIIIIDSHLKLSCWAPVIIEIIENHMVPKHK